MSQVAASRMPPDTFANPVIVAFQKISSQYLLFNGAFILLVAIEVGLTLFFFSSFVDSFILGLSISILFFTLLLYFILRLYSNEQKPEELQALVDNFLASVTAKNGGYFHESERLFQLGGAAEEMADQLSGYRIEPYRLPEQMSRLLPQVTKWGQQLMPYFKKLHIDTFYRRDLMQLQERFLLSAINQRVALLAHTPTDPRVHALLASSYLKLAQHYETGPYYKRALLQALEELKIVDAFEPHNIDVHVKLAHCYHILKMTSQEIQEYEIILKLEIKSHNAQASMTQIDALYTLGLLYFRTGERAKGLRVYEKLKRSQPEKAAQLIHHYGSVHSCT